MDTLTWALALAAGAVAGAVAGLVPGFHTNTLAALLLALAPTAGDWGAHALLAAAAAHAFVSILPSTYVGVPGEETLSVLPAHRMLRQGRAREAVRVAADATLAATLAAVVLLLPFKWLLAEPARLLAMLDAAVVPILAAVILLLVLQERRKGLAAVGKAALCLLVAGALGTFAMTVQLTALVPIPATPLLPLLSGLFGAAGLIHSIATATAMPAEVDDQRPPAKARLGVALATARGVAAAGWTAAMPGLTSAVGASVAMVGTRTQDDRSVIACMSAVGAAHQVFALAMLWLTLRARTGTSIALQDLVDVQRWDVGRPPTVLLLALATLVGAAALGHAATLALDRAGARRLARIDGRRLSAAALLVLVALVLILAGPLGLLLLGLSATVGLLPIAYGVRRVHLTGALIVPALLWRLGFTL